MRVGLARPIATVLVSIFTTLLLSAPGQALAADCPTLPARAQAYAASVDAYNTEAIPFNASQSTDLVTYQRLLNTYIDLDKLAAKTAGSSGADLANIANEAAIIAARANRKKINSDLTEAFEKVAIGPERKSKIMNEKEKELTAYHEAGHASRPDPDSEAKIGASPDPHELLEDLRSRTGVATALGLPPHPNSGLSIRIRSH